MAGIDKTYATSIEEVEEYVRWAEEAVFTCPNKQVLRVINYSYVSREYLERPGVREEMEEEFRNGGEIPVLNSSNELDYFIIKYCPVEFVQRRMEEVHSKDYVESIRLGTSEWDTFQKPSPGKSIRVIEGKPKHRKGLKGWLSVYYVKFPGGDYPWYNSELDIWIFPGELGIWNTSAADVKCRSMKALYRKILKWGFPKGTIVTVLGAYLQKPIKLKIK